MLAIREKHMIENALDRLVDAHPMLFRGRALPFPSHLPEGWLALADFLCAEIANVLGPKQVARFHPLQIKEKLGLLRIYFKLDEADPPTVVDQRDMIHRDRICELIDRAVECSETTCCVCRQPGFLRHMPGNLITVCNAHAVSKETDCPSL